MYSLKQQAINRYLESAGNTPMHTLNKSDEVVWVSADKVMAVLKEHALLKETVAVKLPPMIEAEWDTNDTKEFDRLLQEILFQERTIH